MPWSSPDLECSGDLGPAPSGAALLDTLADWVRHRHGDLLVEEWRGRTLTGDEALHLRLHPVGQGLRLRASADRRLRVEAQTLLVGPGYSVFVGRLLRRAATDLGVRWDTKPPINPQLASEAAQHRLIRAAREVVDKLALDLRFPALLLPATHRFVHNGLVATPLGPRDMKWLAAAAVGALPLADAFVWAAPGLGPRYARGRALALLWRDVRWRPPQDDAEHALMGEVDRLLSAAHTGEPHLDLPWAEWSELLSLAELETELSEEVHQRGGSITSWPPVGYRRRPVEVRLLDDWWARVPGSLAERWRSDGGWEGWEPGRRLVVRVVAGGGPTPPVALQDRGRAQPMVHRDQGRNGQAWLSPPDPQSPTWRLTGHMRTAHSLARVEAEFDRPGDRGWAEAAWRSLRRDAAAQRTAHTAS